MTRSNSLMIDQKAMEQESSGAADIAAQLADLLGLKKRSQIEAVAKAVLDAYMLGFNRASMITMQAIDSALGKHSVN